MLLSTALLPCALNRTNCTPPLSLFNSAPLHPHLLLYPALVDPTACSKMLADSVAGISCRFLTYCPSRRITSEEGLDHKYFTESPLPIKSSMFPTWPAKSEQPRNKRGSSPRPPEGGLAYSHLVTDYVLGGFFFFSETYCCVYRGLSPTSPCDIIACRIESIFCEERLFAYLQSAAFLADLRLLASLIKRADIATSINQSSLGAGGH